MASSSLSNFLKLHLRDYGMLLSLVAIMGFFQVLTDGTLLQPLNLTNLFLQNSYIVVMALGMLLVIVAGHIDLSVGSVCGFIGALAAVLMVRYDWSPFTATLVCLATGALIGGVQGWFVAFLRIPSFIVTLAGMLVFKGLALALLQGESVGPFPTLFQRLSSGFIPDMFNGETLRVSTVVVGPVETELSELHYGDETGVAAVGGTIPMGRMATPADVAEACLYLASPAAAYVTGSTLTVHGGGERPAFLDASNAEEIT